MRRGQLPSSHEGDSNTRPARERSSFLLHIYNGLGRGNSYPDLRRGRVQSQPEWQLVLPPVQCLLLHSVDRHTAGNRNDYFDNGDGVPGGMCQSQQFLGTANCDDW